VEKLAKSRHKHGSIVGRIQNGDKTDHRKEKRQSSLLNEVSGVNQRRQGSALRNDHSKTGKRKNLEKTRVVPARASTNKKSAEAKCASRPNANTSPNGKRKKIRADHVEVKPGTTEQRLPGKSANGEGKEHCQ